MLLTAFGPVTNSIQRIWPGVSSTVGTYNVAVSPTAQATVIISGDIDRYAYDEIAVAPTANAFGCCTYGLNNGTPVATPQATSSACLTGKYILPNVPYAERVAPQTSQECISINGTLTFSGGLYK